MSSNIDRGGNQVRPAFLYPEAGRHYESAQCELIESARNVLEDIQKSQMLQCDVAHAIKDIAKTLRRIDRRMAQKNQIK